MKWKDLWGLWKDGQSGLGGHFLSSVSNLALWRSPGSSREGQEVDTAGRGVWTPTLRRKTYCEDHWALRQVPEGHFNCLLTEATSLVWVPVLEGRKQVSPLWRTRLFFYLLETVYQFPRNAKWRCAFALTPVATEVIESEEPQNGREF